MIKSQNGRSKVNNLEIESITKRELRLKYQMIGNNVQDVVEDSMKLQQRTIFLSVYRDLNVNDTKL